MQSRFILWEKDPTRLGSVRAAAPLLRDVFKALIEGQTELRDFPRESLLALRQELANSGTGAEVILRTIDDVPTLCLANSTSIAELELSVRSSNCFKAASIETLEDLLGWTPDRLMELPHFGRKCLSEVSELLERLGYGGFGEVRRSRPVQTGLRYDNEGVPLAYLMGVQSFTKAEIVAERFTRLVGIS